MDFLQSIPGTIFLPAYILYLIMLMLAARALFFTSAPDESLEGMDMISIAYLKGGPAGVIQTVFFDLWNRGCIEVNPIGQAVIHTEKGPMNALETTVAQELTTYTSVSIGLRKPTKETRQKLEPFLEPVARSLEGRALLMNDAARSRQKALKWAFLALGLLPGILKAYLGITHNRPSIFLILALIIFTVVAFVLMRTRKGATPAAKKYVKSLANQYRGELSTLQGGQVPQTNPAVLAAIFGVGAIAVAYSPLMSLFPSSQAIGCTHWSSYGCTHTGGCTAAGCSSSSSGCSGSGCSGSSGCSGGGGCGGCGGGD